MGKKMSEKDGHLRENKQVEEGDAVKNESDVLNVSTGNANDVSKSSNRDDDKNRRKEDDNEKKDRTKRRKLEFHIDENESPKAQKKHKKSNDLVGEVKEISMETCLGEKENTEQESESSKAMYLENNFEQEAKRVRKDKHKKKNRDDGIDSLATVTETLHSKMQGPVEIQKICSTEDINKSVHGKEGEYEKRKKKKKKKREASGNGHIAVMSSIADGNDADKVNSAGNEVKCRKLRDDFGDAEDGNRGREKKSKSVKNDSEGKHHEGDARTRKSVNTTNRSENATPKERSKKASSRDNDVELFPCADDIDDANKDGKKGLVYGRRFSKEEDEIIMNAVADYIESHNLGDEGLDMVLKCKLYPQVRNCWKEIQAAIPWRPLISVYNRAHVLFERGEKRPWARDECEVILNFVEKHGPKWKLLADSLGRNFRHVHDTWRRIRLTNRKRGHWSQEEIQKLFDLVNLDLSVRVFEEKRSKYGMLRDNICWTVISDKMETRASYSCCIKWYQTLASPMVAEGIWADADDYRMLGALFSLDACCMEDVGWDNLIEHRSGDLCRKRWGQMVRHLDQYRDKSFAEQVEILANRYHPDMLDAREAYDRKCPVDLP